MIWLLAALTLTAPEISSAEFSPDSETWNGLAYLTTTAAEAKVELEVLDGLDWGEVTPERVLLLVMPNQGVKGDDVLQFVRDGGHAVIALDRGANAGLARAFGLTLLDGPVIHDAYYRDHPAFPEIEPDGASPPTHGQQHFLWYNVDDIVLNHPAALQIDSGGPRRREAEVLIPFAEPDQAFAVQVRLGGGYALFISDASVLINDMQRHAYGDKQLAANLMRYYCEDECRVDLVLPSAVVVGSYKPRHRGGVDGLRFLFTVAVDELNTMLAVWSGKPGEVPALGLGIFGLVALLLFGLLLSPWPTPARRFAWEDGRKHAVSHVDYWVSALSRARRQADFSRPGLALLAQVQSTVATLLPGAKLDDPARHAQLATAVRRLGGDAAVEALLRCAHTLRTVRAWSGDPRPDGGLGLDAFETLWADTQTILALQAEPTRRSDKPRRAA